MSIFKKKPELCRSAKKMLDVVRFYYVFDASSVAVPPSKQTIPPQTAFFVEDEVHATYFLTNFDRWGRLTRLMEYNYRHRGIRPMILIVGADEFVFRAQVLAFRDWAKLNGWNLEKMPAWWSGWP